METQHVQQDFHALLPDNPFVPPKGDVCFINNLPPELLSRIFEVGVVDTDTEDEDDYSPETTEIDDKGSHDGDIDDGTGEDDNSEEDDEETDDDEYTDSSSDLSPPWPPFQIIVSHVCRHWRHVALSTPSLWTTIVVSAKASPPYQHVSALLKRSKSLPIDIYINCEPQDDDSEADGPSEADLIFLYNLLIPHVHRWRTIEISVSEYHQMFVFLNAVSDPIVTAAPQLTTLQLYHHEETEELDTFGYPKMSTHFTLFGGFAPYLTSVVLWGVHVDWDQQWIASAPRLEDLELAYHTEDIRPSWRQLSIILRGATSLEKLSLCSSGPSGDPPEWFIEPTPGGPGELNAPILLPKVTDFILAFHSQPRAIGLVRKFVLPAIKNLALDFDMGDYAELVDVLAGPATSLSPPSAQEEQRSLLSGLDSLKLSGLPCPPESIDVLYSKLQNLTSLNISLSYLHDDFLDLLGARCASTGRGDIRLPRLTTLYVSGTSGDALREVVGRRKSAGVPLHSLYVEESCGLSGKDKEWLRRNLATFALFEGSDDEDVLDFGDLQESEEDMDEWIDID